MNPLHDDHLYVARGHNPLLGGLICFTCQEHARMSIDKTLWYNWREPTSRHAIYVYRTGELSIGCNCCSIDVLQSILTTVESKTQADLMPFGQGVALEMDGKRMECAQCGSEEFCLPSKE